MLANIIRNAKKSAAASGGDPYYSAVSLLLPMDGADGSTTFTDASSNALTVTATGDAKISTAQSKYGASGYFDGTGDYLSIPWNSSLALTGDFTVEAWIYPTATPNGSAWIAEQYTGGTNTIAWCFGFVDSATAVTTGSKLFFGSYSGSAWSGVLASTGLTVNQWSHVAAVRIGSTLTVYLNGTAVGSGTFTASISTGDGLYVGRRWDSYVASPFFQGYLDDIRVSRFARYTSAFTPPTAALPTYASSTPADPYYGQTSLLLHMDGANASTAFVDSGPNALAVTASGNAQISTAQSKFGGASGSFDGTNSYASLSYNSAFALGSSDWTAEFWMRCSSLSSEGTALTINVPVGGSGWSSIRISVLANGSMRLLAASGSSTWINTNTTATGLITTGNWYHIAAVRSGSTFTLYINGASALTYTSSSALYDFSGVTALGCTFSSNSANIFFNGFIDDLRITKGLARYQSNFTPPTKAYPNLYNPYKTLPVSGAALWLDASKQTSLFTDAGVTSVTTSGQSIYQWNDLSGNNRHAIQATSGNRPTWLPPASGRNGLGAVQFDGVNDSLSGDFGTTSIMNGTFTLHGVFQWTSNSNTAPVFFYSGDRTTSKDRILWYYTGNGRYDQYASGIIGAAMTSGTWYRFTLIKNSLTSVTLEMNGTSVTGSVTNANLASTIYQLASIKAETNGYANMKWAELALFPSTQSSGDQTSMVNYLKAKWGTS